LEADFVEISEVVFLRHQPHFLPGLGQPEQIHQEPTIQTARTPFPRKTNDKCLVMVARRQDCHLSRLCRGPGKGRDKLLLSQGIWRFGSFHYRKADALNTVSMAAQRFSHVPEIAEYGLFAPRIVGG